MKMRISPKFANKVLLPACLLAVTTFTIGSWQVRAQSSAAPKVIRVSSGSLVTPEAHTPSKVLDGTAIRVSHYTPESKLRLALAIQAPHMAEEEQFIKELTTKGSTGFHKFLTRDEWNARFGPSVEDEQAVVDWAQSVGLTVTRRYPNRLLVDVEAPAGLIEKAFGVTINNYKVDDEVDFSNDSDPVVPSNLSGILHTVLGLNNIERAHRLGTSKPTVKGPDYVPGPAISKAFSVHGDGDPTRAPAAKARSEISKPTPSDSFPLSGGVANPDNIQSSEGYDYNALQRLSFCCNEWGDSSGSPPESSIALVGYGNYNYSDATTFFNNYGMAWNLSSYYINGSGFPGVDDEAPLDVEYSAAMSNSYGSYLDTAQVIEYEMPNNQYATYADAFEAIDSDNFADVVSTSYGWQENVGFSGSVATGTMHPIFNTMIGEGKTLIAASGDMGASAGCQDATSVWYPASDPDFLAAGGTQLLLDSNGIFESEIGWQGESWTNADNDGNGGACANNHGGSTGGVSVLFAAPSWQSTLVSPFNLYKDGAEYVETGNANRLVPDIALTANPDVMGEWYYSGGSWQSEGGTSIVAPELAGFFAQENSYLDFIGSVCGSGGTSACSPVGLATPFIYEDALDGAPHNPFYDMLSGCNDNDITAADNLFYYCAAPGFDLVTGWGSANMLQLAWGINWELIPAVGNPSLAFSGPATNTWYNTDQIVGWNLSDAGSSGLPAPGAAGFTQGWDSIPSDPSSEPHGGQGNSFYSGPEYPYSTGGCQSFNGAGGCSAGSGQGCHTVQVEGFDNQGRTTFGSYGPVCYDTVAPTIKVTNNPGPTASGWWKGNVKVTLTAADPGGSAASGIGATYYAIDSTSCTPSALNTCSTYGSPFTITAQGAHYIYYFTEDRARNFSTESVEWVYIDTTAPVTTASLSGTLTSGTYYSAVQVTLSATDSLSGVATTYYTIDGGAQTTYSGAFSVSALGSHTVKYWSVDNAGNVETAHTAAFTIASSLPTLTSPTPDSVLGTTNVKFTWTAAVGATDYRLFLGTTGVGSLNLYNSGTLTGLTTTVPSIPSNGVTVYAQLLAKISGTWQSENYTFTESSTSSPAVLSTPAPGTVLGPSNVVFTWTAGVGVTNYKLLLGTTGVGSSNLYSSGSITTTTATVATLPQTGVTVYAQLSSEIGGVWQSNNYTFTESELAAMKTPAPGATLGTTNVVFTWTAGVGSTDYRLFVGTTGVGSLNLYNSGTLTTTTATVPSIPASGATVYVRLYSKIAGAWQSVDYTYKEQ